jgi:glutathione S-transferase
MRPIEGESEKLPRETDIAKLEVTFGSARFMICRHLAAEFDMTSAHRTLVIGDKNLSSWSLRPWLLLQHFQVDFKEVLLKLDTPEFALQVQRYSPSKRVPALIDGAVSIWDSLAICEYVNEQFLQGRGYPSASAERALARAVVAEMHSGFASLRQQMPMNLQRTPTPIAAISAQTQADIQRICALWRELLGRFGGPYLFGEFSIADCFYAPVATRFRQYSVTLGSAESGYVESIYQNAAFKLWREAALLETRP